MSTSTASRSSLSIDIPRVRMISDRQNCIPLTNIMSGEEVVVLLTPVVTQVDRDPRASADPFEPFGKALAERYGCIRHVPYTKRQGITGVHVAFIKRAKVVIFILTSFAEGDGVSQAMLAEIAGTACANRPFIVLACCEMRPEDMQASDFPTLLQTNGYSQEDLLAAASHLCEGPGGPSSPHTQSSARSVGQTGWNVQPWNQEEDTTEAYILWNEALPLPFQGLNQNAFARLVHRDGYARHYSVRDPSTRVLIAFCFTYTTYENSTDGLIASIAAIVVRESHRRQGIGSMLHNAALQDIRKVRGISRTQLGSTFPRLLPGIPRDLPEIAFFEKLGWTVMERKPGRGFPLIDWFMPCEAIPNTSFSSAGLYFRQYEASDREDVITLAQGESERRLCFGWYDQYAKIVNGQQAGDIVLASEGDTLVATAITYVSGSSSLIAADLPWAGSIGNNIGGISCICIKDGPETTNRRDTILARLLHVCCRHFKQQGQDGIFVDGVRGSEQTFSSLGFQRWAEYREVWKTEQ